MKYLKGFTAFQKIVNFFKLPLYLFFFNFGGFFLLKTCKRLYVLLKKYFTVLLHVFITVISLLFGKY